MPDLTVIICAHSPRADYLNRVIGSLRHQTLPMSQWEFLLVDNASESLLAQSFDLSWHSNGRHVRENELGVTVARLRGIRESNSDLIVFVDDDNVLDPNYLSEALKIATEWPRLGIWGSGVITAEYEALPTEYVSTLTPYLALRHATKASWSNVFPCVEATPWGAGMCIRRIVATEYHKMNEDSRILISSRRGKKILLSGEDVEMSNVACSIGFGMGVFPELKLTHLITKERVSPQYLLKLFQGTSTSNLLLAYKWKGNIPKSPLRPWGLLSIFKNVILQRGLDRQKYLANIRAMIAARRIIKSSQAPRPGNEA